jgi:lipoprotein LprG
MIQHKKALSIQWAKSILSISLVSCFLFITGCSPEAAQAPPATEIVENSVSKMLGVSSFEFEMKREGPPTFIDPVHSIAVSRMAGTYVSPDRVQAVVRIIAPGIVSDVDVISIGEQQWETNPLSGEWQELPPEWGFNPALLFDAKSGLQTILRNDLNDVELVDQEELEEWPGLTLYHVEGQLSGDKIYQMSFGLIGPDITSINLWIDPRDFSLFRMVITEPPDEEGELTTWTMDFWDFDREQTIVPPEDFSAED